MKCRWPWSVGIQVVLLRGFAQLHRTKYIGSGD
jgi:hypothetical protein